MNQNANFNLLQEGLQSYVDALLAIREFCREVGSKSRRVLEANVDDIQQILHRELRADSMTDFVSPNCLAPAVWDGTWAWATAKLSVPDLCDIYVGLLWRVEANGIPRPGVVVDFAFYDRQLFVKLSQLLRDLAGERVQPTKTYKELMIWEPIDPANAENFTDRLAAITKEWVDLLRKIPPEVLPAPRRG